MPDVRHFRWQAVHEKPFVPRWNMQKRMIHRAFQIQQCHYRRTVYPRNADIHIVWQTVPAIPVDTASRNFFQQPPDKIITQPAFICHLFLQNCCGTDRRPSDSYNSRYVFGTGPHLPLLSTTMDHRLKLQSFRAYKNPVPFGPLNL